MIEKNNRQMSGLVISSKRDKTITVLIERKVKHPIYKKIIRRSTKLQAHKHTITSPLNTVVVNNNDVTRGDNRPLSPLHL